MNRRDFVLALGGAMAWWPIAARAQPASPPVVGFLRSSPAAPFTNLVAAFRKGLGETGFVEGRSVVVEYRWADNRLDRLPDLAADLVRRGAAVIVGNRTAIEAARAVSPGTPIVFVIADDPVKRGLVASLNRPGGNVTGITFFGGGLLIAKRLEMLHELIPGAATIAVLLDSTYPWSGGEMPSLKAAARALGRRLVVEKAASERDFDAAFDRIAAAHAGALLVGGGPMFTSKRRRLIELASRRALPAIYDQRSYVASGGLISYGTSFAGAYRQAGVYAGRILKGTKPADLPVIQPKTFELAVNLGTAKTLGLRVPLSILARADEVVE